MRLAVTARWFTRLAALSLLLGCGVPVAAAAPLGPRMAARAVCPAPTSQIMLTSVPSAVYGKNVAVSVYLPACYDAAGGMLPVIYMLHGGNADETQWPDLRVQPEADGLIAGGAAPFVVVMPGGVYRDGLDYAAFVLGDLLPGIEQQFAVKASGAGRAIGGISLGGYWALKIAFQHPDQFAAAGGNSPVVGRGAADDPLALARTGAGLAALRIRLDVGDGDSLRDSTTLLADVLRARGLSVELSVQPGYHNRPYWRSHTLEYLAFYLAALHPSSTCHHRSSY
jgi:enterochelin esterase-like enzyme